MKANRETEQFYLNTKIFHINHTTISDIINHRIWSTNKELKNKKHENRLTENEVREIRELKRTKNYTTVELGKMFNVSSTAIGYIIKYKSYPNII